MAEWAFCVRVINETAVDSGDGLTFDLHGVDGQALPAPVVRVNGVTKTLTVDYTFSNGSTSVACSITFVADQTGNTVTCDYRWKYTCTDEEDASVYEAGKDMAVATAKDVNGYDLIAIGYAVADAYKGLLTFEYMETTFWREWVTIAENGYFFDLIRTSDSVEPRTINNLLCTSFPRMIDIPGVPDRIHVTVEWIQAA